VRIRFALDPPKNQAVRAVGSENRLRNTGRIVLVSANIVGPETFQVVIGGVLVFVAGIVIGSS
jgi:hypothetical protein